jgi:hypothetical protein
MFTSLTSQADNPWFWAGMFALIFDLFIGISILVGWWKLMRGYRGRQEFHLALLVTFALAFLLIIPGVAGESRFRAPADPLLALAAGWAWLPWLAAQKNSATGTNILHKLRNHAEET